MKKITCFLFLLFSFAFSKASHLVVGEMSYKHLGGNTYEITVYYYQDCLNGNPPALEGDNPLFVSIFNGQNFFSFDSIYVDESEVLPSQNPNSCESSNTPTCIKKVKFTIIKNLPPSTEEYLIINERCCMSEAISNISLPGTLGHAFYCKVPPSIQGINNSASFAPVSNTKFCVGKKYIIDHSATDPDGDSLSYGFDLLDKGGSNNDPKPIITTYPSFTKIPYLPPYTKTQPMPGLSVDEKTGILTLNSLMQGTFAVNIFCNEWRNGVIINTIKRTYIYTIYNCQFEVNAGIVCDTLLNQMTNGKLCLSNCSGKTIEFKSKSTNNVIKYHWDFGVAGMVNDTSDVANPMFTFPDTGTYKVTLHVYGANCTDSIVEQVAVYNESPSVDFSVSGKLCTGSELEFTINSIDSFSFSRWDFSPSNISLYGNPCYNRFFTPGLNQIQLTAITPNGCKATRTQEIDLSSITIKAYADTNITTYAPITLTATGAETYQWEVIREFPAPIYPVLNPPAANTQNLELRAYLKGQIDFMVVGMNSDGCGDADTLRINISDKAYYFVPNAFTPNGDNLNDLVKIHLSGYTLINFKIYNRRGQQMFYTQDYTQGWDGTFKGEKMAMETYHWMATLRDANNKKSVVGGDVILMR
jgi:gliding motility-associated-like protein